MSGRPPGALRTSAILLPTGLAIAAVAYLAARQDPASTLNRLPAPPQVDVGAAPVAPPPRPPGVPLAHFREALDDLARGYRRRHVRVALFGDSHTQGGAFTTGLRDAFAVHYPRGGPGFFHLGSREHPQGRLHARYSGAFTVEPRDPASPWPREDALFGLAGLRVRAKAGAEATLRVEAPVAVLWDVCFRGTGGAVVRTGDRDFPASPATTHAVVRSTGALSVRVTAGEVTFCGAAVENDPEIAPGIVVDSMGINGARYATFTTWDEADFVSELRRRAPDLVIFAYGTNEASDEPPRVDAYREDATRAITRVRRAVPDASCILVGPTDRRGREPATKAITAALDRVAMSAGCAFWNTYEKMRARGPIQRWMEDELAQDDGIHLTHAGYQALAGDLARDILPPQR